MPKWLLSAAIQVGLPTGSFYQCSATSELVPRTSSRTTSARGSIVREPIGVVGCITPWNYPLHQIAAKVAYALGAGCTVVLKPSRSGAGQRAFILAEIIDDLGFLARRVQSRDRDRPRGG